MFNYILITSFISFCLLVFSPPLIAEEMNGKISPRTPLDWLSKDKELQDWCQQNILLNEAKIFNNSKQKAKKIRASYCAKEFASPQDLRIQITNLIGDLELLFPVSKINLQMHSRETSRANSTGELAQFEVLDDPLLAISLDHGPVYRIEDSLLKECNSSAKQKSVDMDCESALKEFEVIYNFAQGTYSQPLAFELSKRLSFLEKRWENFYQKSKSQTLWEMAINGSFFQKDNREHEFAEPPSWQLIVMHPTVVVESVSGAIDGDQLKEAVMIEAIGADWWQQDKWFLPSGGSFIAIYSDRADVDDWGYGFALNFDSKFTLGASDHGGDLGVFVTIDLLKLIQNKASIIDSYRGSLNF